MKKSEAYWLLTELMDKADSKYSEALLTAMDLLQSEDLLSETPTADVAEVKWIPVTERLPKGRRDYLCICVFDESDMPFYNVLMFHPEQNAENGYVTGPHFSNEGMGGMRVTHWMPLPKLPSGAKMDGKEDA